MNKRLIHWRTLSLVLGEDLLKHKRRTLCFTVWMQRKYLPSIYLTKKRVRVLNSRTIEFVYDNDTYNLVVLSQ